MISDRPQKDVRSPAESEPVWPAPRVVARRCLADPDLLEVAWGEGSERAFFRTNSPALATWLVGLSGPTTVARMAEEIARTVGLPIDRARNLINRFIAAGLVRSAPAGTTEAERIWSTIGWRDAAVLHAATRDTRWDHERLGRDRPPELLPLPRVDHSPHAVPLPPASGTLAQADTIEVLRRRRTHRNFTGTTISAQQLSDILHCTFRPVSSAAADARHSTQFSARVPGESGPVHPLTAFLLLDPKNGPADLLSVDWRFRYNPVHHALEPTGNGRPETESISELLWDQDFSVGAPAFIIFAVNWYEYMTRCPASYAYRLTQFDLGAFMQTALMVAAALDVRTFLTPALDDERFARILGTEDSEQAPGYMLALGARTG